MRLTRASHYALIALTHMAQQAGPTANPIASHEIAKARNIPMRFLLKVLKPLVDNGILFSHKGPTGGYVLAHSPSQITLLQIVESVDGKIRGEVPDPWPGNPDEGVLPDPVAEKSNVPVNARLLDVSKKCAQAIKDQLRSVRLSELAAPKESRRAKKADPGP